MVLTDLGKETDAPWGQEEKPVIVSELPCELNRWFRDNFLNPLRRVSDFFYLLHCCPLG